MVFCNDDIKTKPVRRRVHFLILVWCFDEKFILISILSNRIEWPPQLMSKVNSAFHPSGIGK